MAHKTDNPAEPIGPPALPTKAPATGSDDAKAEAAAVPPAATNDVTILPADLDTPESDAAIDDIVAQEADQVLAAQDAGIEAAQADVEPADAKSGKHGHPIFWFLIVLLVTLAMIVAYVLMNPGLNLPFSS